MENKPVSTFKTALNFGLITAALLIVYGLILFLFDVGFESIKNFGYLSYVIIIAMLILGIRSQKIADGGFISYGKAFTVSFLIVLIAFFLSNIYNYVYFSYIDPGMTEEIAAQAVAQAEENILKQNPDASRQDMEMAITMTEKFTTPMWMVIWGFVMSMIVGTIVSLIIPIFMMKKHPVN